MAKFCSNCGAQMDDAAVVCGNCGAALEGAADVQPKAKADPMAQVKELIAKVPKKFIPVIGAALAAFVLIIVIALIATSGSSKSLIKKYEKAMFAEDSKSVVELYYTFNNEDYTDLVNGNWKKLLNNGYYDNGKECSYVDYLEEEFGDGVKIKKVEILDETKYSKDDESFEDIVDRLKAVENSYNEMIKFTDSSRDEIDFSADDVKAVKRVTYKITFKGDDKTDSAIKTAWLIKVKGGWKFVPDYYSYWD